MGDIFKRVVFHKVQEDGAGDENADDGEDKNKQGHQHLHGGLEGQRLAPPVAGQAHVFGRMFRASVTDVPILSARINVRAKVERSGNSYLAAGSLMASRRVFPTLISCRTVLSSSTMTDGGDFSTTHFKESMKSSPALTHSPKKVDGVRQFLDDNSFDPLDLSLDPEFRQQITAGKAHT